MPNKSKSRNNSRNTNTSRKSAASQESAPRVDPEDDWGNILIKSKPSSRNTTPKNKVVIATPAARPDFLEPLSPKPVTPPPPPPTPWEILGMPETDYHAMMNRVRQQMADSMRENYINNLLADLENPSFWLRRIEQLEKEREFFNKKRGWSAIDIAAVDRIDEELQECEDELERIYAQEDRLEAEYD